MELSQELGLRFQAHAAVLEQLEVVPAAIAEIKIVFCNAYIGFSNPTASPRG